MEELELPSKPGLQVGWQDLQVRVQLGRAGGLAQPALDRLAVAAGPREAPAPRSEVAQALGQALPGGRVHSHLGARVLIDVGNRHGHEPGRNDELEAVDRVGVEFPWCLDGHAANASRCSARTGTAPRETAP